jgi:hypothetical protein
MHLDVMADGKAAGKIDTMQTKSGDAYSFSLSMPVRPATILFDPWLRVLREHARVERPSAIQEAVRAGLRRVFRPQSRKDWMPSLPAGNASLPQDLKGYAIVATPDDEPALAPLFAKVGFVVEGDKLTWRGTTIDLRENCAMALVDIGNGGLCLLALGRSELEPNTGSSQVCLADRLGRFLRGETAPASGGELFWRLGDGSFTSPEDARQFWIQPSSR